MGSDSLRQGGHAAAVLAPTLAMELPSFLSISIWDELVKVGLIILDSRESIPNYFRFLSKISFYSVVQSLLILSLSEFCLMYSRYISMLGLGFKQLSHEMNCC